MDVTVKRRGRPPKNAVTPQAQAPAPDACGNAPAAQQVEPTAVKRVRHAVHEAIDFLNTDAPIEQKLGYIARCLEEIEEEVC